MFWATSSNVRRFSFSCCWRRKGIYGYSDEINRYESRKDVIRNQVGQSFDGAAGQLIDHICEVARGVRRLDVRTCDDKPWPTSVWHHGTPKVYVLALALDGWTNCPGAHKCRCFSVRLVVHLTRRLLWPSGSKPFGQSPMQRARLHKELWRTSEINQKAIDVPQTQLIRGLQRVFRGRCKCW